MNLDTYRMLRAQARRLSRVAGDADDLVQDTLLAALQAGRSDAPWLSGTLRRQAALAARSALRRRQRETLSVADTEVLDALPTGKSAAPHLLLTKLPRAARRLATLALHGLNADEIRWILDITPAAFRQRQTSIRKTLEQLPAALRQALTDQLVEHETRTGTHAFGLLRRALKAALRGHAGLGTHDADGHLLVLGPRAGNGWAATRAHTFGPGGNLPVLPKEKRPC